MNAFQFGRQLRIKIAQQPGMRTQMQPGGTLTMNPGPNTPASPSAIVSGGTQGANIRPAGPPPQPKPTPGLNRPSTGSFLQEYFNPPTPSRASGAPTNSPFINTLDRWYNPWTRQTGGYEKGEKGLMRAGQAAMGTAAAAGTLAAGVAAAPTVAGTLGTGGTAAAGTTAAGTAASPAGQNFIQRAGQMVGQVGNQVGASAQSALNTANRAAYAYQQNVQPVLNRINYQPQALGKDLLAVATGNYKDVQGPGWSGSLAPLGGPSMGLPQGSGAPSLGLPSPLKAIDQAGTAFNQLRQGARLF